MLNELEIKNVSNLLMSSDMATFRLGLLLVDSNLAHIDEWLDVLSGLRLVSHKEKLKALDAWFLTHQKNELIQNLLNKQKQNKFFQFLRWAAEGREYLEKQKLKNKAYAAHRADFIAHLDFYKKLFLEGDDPNQLNDNLMIHFYYCENDYFLATEIALLPTAKPNLSIYSYWDFFKLLIYFYFPNDAFLDWKPRVLAWAENVWASNAKDYHKCFYLWIKGLMLKYFGELEAAEKCFFDTLEWADTRLQSSYERCILSSMHACLAELAIHKKDTATAKKHLAIASQHDDYFTTDCQLMLLEGKNAEAVVFLETQAKRRPITEEYWEMLANIALQQNKPDKAIYYYTQSVQHSPQYRKHFLSLIQLLENSQYPNKQALIEKYSAQVQALNTQFERLAKLAKF